MEDFDEDVIFALSYFLDNNYQNMNLLVTEI